MYIRFAIPKWDQDTGVETGFLSGAFSVTHENRRTQSWLRDEILRELDWFDANLDEPERFSKPGGRHPCGRCVCWFRPEAREAINRARYVGWLLGETGLPVTEIRRRYPGKIIWRDHMQVVAKPATDHPRVFH